MVLKSRQKLIGGLNIYMYIFYKKINVFLSNQLETRLKLNLFVSPENRENSCLII